MPRVPDHVLRSVVYLGYDTTFEFGGTAFVVAYPIERWDQTAEEPEPLHTWDGSPHQCYLVTARHILDGIKDRKGFDHVRVRINSRSGGFVEPYPEFPISAWTRLEPDPATGHFRDVAVIPFDPTSDYDIEPVAITTAALPNRIRHAGIGIGNELFYPGLFVRKPGEKRNLPVLRVGILSGMAEDDEPVMVDWYGNRHEIVAHLMETRSLQGLSGSPVFVHWPGIREEPKSTEGWRVTSLVSQREFYLLGLVSGHWDDDKATPSGIRERVNVGIGYATPVDDIVEALDMSEHVRHRRDLATQWGKNQREEQVATMDTPEEEHAGPTGTLYGFYSDVRRATRWPDEQPDKGAVRSSTAILVALAVALAVAGSAIAADVSTAQIQTVSTVVLAAVTVLYVWFTQAISAKASESAASAAESAVATERAAAAAERGLLLHVMPLVFGHKVQETGGGRTQVTLFGFGQFPAFQIMVEVHQGRDVGTAGPFDNYDPAGGPREIDLNPGFELVDYPNPYHVEVTYYDALGTPYRTRRDSLLGGQSLTKIDRMDEDSEEWISLV